MNIASVVQGLASVMWLVALGVLGFTVFNAARGRKFGGGATLVVGAVVLAVALTVVAAGIVFIEPDERGVVISPYDQRGYRDTALTPGLRWIIPGERVQTYSIARQSYTMSSAEAEGQVTGDDSIQARTKDGQIVFVDASVIYAIDPDNVINLHIIWQGRFEEGVVRPQSRGVIRDAVSQYGIEEIVSSKRAELEQTLTDELTKGLASNNLVLVDFVLRNIRFSDEYAAAVEQKQIAEQQAQQAFFVVEQRKQEAEQARQVAQGQADAVIISAEGRAQATVLQAQAEAQALQLISDALKDNPDLLTFRYIDKLAPNVQVMYLPSGSPYLIPLPTAPASTSSETVIPTPAAPTTSTTTTP
jgi:regulator of protease activity HflC (stomatin/prohibitin superfamily)